MTTMQMPNILSHHNALTKFANWKPNVNLLITGLVGIGGGLFINYKIRDNDCKTTFDKIRHTSYYSQDMKKWKGISIGYLDEVIINKNFNKYAHASNLTHKINILKTKSKIKYFTSNDKQLPNHILYYDPEYKHLRYYYI